MSRCIRLQPQPPRARSSASQSSSSGCVGRVPSAPEVAGRLDQATPEMLEPDPVREHPPHERMPAVDQVAGVRQDGGRWSAGSGHRGDLEPLAVRRGDGQVARLDRRLRLAVIAAMEEVRRARHRAPRRAR